MSPIFFKASSNSFSKSLDVMLWQMSCFVIKTALIEFPCFSCSTQVLREERPYYDYTVAPQKNGVVVIIIPRRLQFFVIPIQDNVVNEHLQLDNAVVKGRGGLVGIEELCKTVKEMIGSEEGPG